MAVADTSMTETKTETTAPIDAPAAVAAAPSLDDATIMGGGEKPAEEAKPDTPAAPEGAPEKYELALPEGVALDADAMTIAEPVLRELNLSNEQASKLAAVYPKLAQAATDRASQQVITEVIAQRKAWADESRELPDIGGAQFEASKVNAARFIDNFGGARLKAVLDETGLGNHPALFAAFAKAGRDLAEDRAVTAQTAAPPPKTLGERYYGTSA